MKAIVENVDGFCLVSCTEDKKRRKGQEDYENPLKTKFTLFKFS